MMMRKTFSLGLACLCLVMGLGGFGRALALTVPPGATIEATAEAIKAEGTAPEQIAGYASTLLAQGISPGDVAAALLSAGFGTFQVVETVLVEGVVYYARRGGDPVQVAADDLVREVAARVFFIQGPTAGSAIRNGIDAARLALLARGHLPGDSASSRFVRGGADIDPLLEESLVLAAAAGATWQSETAPGGQASFQ